MELNELPQMDPRALKATSVKAEDEHANSAEPQALKITAASSNPKMFTLPWHKPLATWPKDLLANLPRGISRHVVRFVHVGDEVYYGKFGGNEVKVDGEDFLLLRADDIYAIIED